MNQRIPNPECRDGKHRNCDGHGWDIDADTAVRCPCHCHSAYHEQHVKGEGVDWRWDCDTCNPLSQHKHGPLVLDPHKGWQCNGCGEWLPLDYKGPQQVHPQASDIVTAEGLRHIDHCDQCRQTFNVIGRIAYDEDELTDHSDTYTI